MSQSIWLAARITQGQSGFNVSVLRGGEQTKGMRACPSLCGLHPREGFVAKIKCRRWERRGQREARDERGGLREHGRMSERDEMNERNGRVAQKRRRSARRADTLQSRRGRGANG
jgi:hypothetical protein